MLHCVATLHLRPCKAPFSQVVRTFDPAGEDGESCTEGARVGRNGQDGLEVLARARAKARTRGRRHGREGPKLVHGECGCLGALLSHAGGCGAECVRC